MILGVAMTIPNALKVSYNSCKEHVIGVIGLGLHADSGHSGCQAELVEYSCGQ